MKKKISDVIEKAINVHLWDGRLDDYWDRTSSDTYSCPAVGLAYKNKYGLLPNNIREGFEEMGLATDSSSQFREFERLEERQYARALWLTWAAMMAREQGL